MKNKIAFTLLSSLIACALLLAACGTGTEIPDSKNPKETSVAPENTISKEGQTLALYEPAPEVTEPGNDPWGIAPSEPGDAPIALPGEGAHAQPGLISIGKFQEVRVQDLGLDQMNYLIGRYMPEPGSESNLSWVQIADADALTGFLAEVDSPVFRDACAPYGADFFSMYDLIVIPRMTNTGSVQHSVELVREGDKLRVLVGVTEPEYSTQVLTNWLLVVPVLKAELQGMNLVVGMDRATDLPMPTVGVGK